MTTPLLTRTGWLNKKERTPKPWGKASHSRRHFVSDGLGVTYYEKEGADQRGAINLRQVSSLRPTSDATAPTEAVDLVVSGRTYTLEPQPSTRDERDAWLRLWVNAVPVAAVAPELSYLQVGLAARTVVWGPSPAGVLRGVPASSTFPRAATVVAGEGGGGGDAGEAWQARELLQDGGALSPPLPPPSGAPRRRPPSPGPVPPPVRRAAS